MARKKTQQLFRILRSTNSRKQFGVIWSISDPMDYSFTSSLTSLRQQDNSSRRKVLGFPAQTAMRQTQKCTFLVAMDKTGGRQRQRQRVLENVFPHSEGNFPVRFGCCFRIPPRYHFALPHWYQKFIRVANVQHAKKKKKKKTSLSIVSVAEILDISSSYQTGQCNKHAWSPHKFTRSRGQSAD